MATFFVRACTVCRGNGRRTTDQGDKPVGRLRPGRLGYWWVSVCLLWLVGSLQSAAAPTVSASAAARQPAVRELRANAAAA